MRRENDCPVGTQSGTRQVVPSVSHSKKGKDESMKLLTGNRTQAAGIAGSVAFLHTEGVFDNLDPEHIVIGCLALVITMFTDRFGLDRGSLGKFFHRLGDRFDRSPEDFPYGE